MKICVLLALALQANAGFERPRSLGDSETKSAFFVSVKNLLFLKIKEYFGTYLKSPDELTIKVQANEEWQDYNTAEPHLEDHVVGVFVKGHEVFKMRMRSNVISEPLLSGGETGEKVGEQPVVSGTSREKEKESNVTSQTRLEEEIVEEVPNDTNQTELVKQEEITEVPIKKGCVSGEEDCPEEEDDNAIEGTKLLDPEEPKLDGAKDIDNPTGKTQLMTEEVIDQPEEEVIHEPFEGLNNGLVQDDPLSKAGNKTGQNKTEEELVGVDLRRARLRERKLLSVDNRNLCVEMTSGNLKANFALQYGFRLNPTITVFILRNLQSFFYKVNQLIFSLAQIEPDIEALFATVFQNYGKNISNLKRINGVEDAPKISALEEYDIDANYVKMRPSFHALDNPLTFVLQKVDLAVLETKAKDAQAYFEARISDFKKTALPADARRVEHLVYVVSPNRFYLDPIELLILKAGNVIYLYVYSPILRSEQMLNDISVRFMIKSLEREFVKIRDQVLFYLSQLQEERPRPYPISDLAVEIETRFGNLLKKESESAEAISFVLNGDLPTTFSLKLYQLEFEVEVLFVALQKTESRSESGGNVEETASTQKMIMRKRFATNSLFYTFGFPATFILELSQNILAVVPRFSGSSEAPLVFEGINNSYYKNSIIPFVDSTESSQDTQGENSFFDQQPHRPKDHVLKQFFYRQTGSPVSSYSVEYGWAKADDLTQDSWWSRLVQVKRTNRILVDRHNQLIEYI